jgi:hypothetical protein
MAASPPRRGTRRPAAAGGRSEPRNQENNRAAESGTADSARAIDQPDKTYRLAKLVLPGRNMIG